MKTPRPLTHAIDRVEALAQALGLAQAENHALKNRLAQATVLDRTNFLAILSAGKNRSVETAENLAADYLDLNPGDATDLVAMAALEDEGGPITPGDVVALLKVGRQGNAGEALKLASNLLNVSIPTASEIIRGVWP